MVHRRYCNINICPCRAAFRSVGNVAELRRPAIIKIGNKADIAITGKADLAMQRIKNLADNHSIAARIIGKQAC